jgi:hypothetical protein
VKVDVLGPALQRALEERSLHVLGMGHAELDLVRLKKRPKHVHTYTVHGHRKWDEADVWDRDQL